MRTGRFPSPQRVPTASTALAPAPLPSAGTAVRMEQGSGPEGPRPLLLEGSLGLGWQRESIYLS